MMRVDFTMKGRLRSVAMILWALVSAVHVYVAGGGVQSSCLGSTSLFPQQATSTSVFWST